MRRKRFKTVGEVVAHRDRATPTQRRWLDRLQRAYSYGGTFTMRRYYLNDPSGWVTVVQRVLANGEARCGVIAGGSVAWLRREVRRVESRNRREEARELRNEIGAFI
jgi:hypothetical protein